MRIDAYTHFIPAAFFTKIGGQRLSRHRQAHARNPLHPRSRRAQEVVDSFKDYAQILSYPMPPLELLAKGAADRRICKVINDGFADICAKDPDQFPGWVAEAPIGAPDAGVERMRARDQERRARRADPHQHRRQAARRSGVRAVLRDHEQAQQADLAAPGARRQFPRLPERDRNRNTKSGGPSAGPTRPRRRWRGWCSPRSWTNIRT